MFKHLPTIARAVPGQKKPKKIVLQNAYLVQYM